MPSWEDIERADMLNRLKRLECGQERHTRCIRALWGILGPVVAALIIKHFF